MHRGGKDKGGAGGGGLGRQDSMPAALKERDPNEEAFTEYPKEYGNDG